MLDRQAIRHSFESRPGQFLAVAITDGCISNVPATVVELRRVVDKGCDLILLHVGQRNNFTEAIEAINCPVHIIKNAADLIGLTLQIANERYQHPKN